MGKPASEATVAEMVLQRQQLRPGDRFEYEVVNHGRVALMFGASYGVDRKTATGWESVNSNAMFRAWGKRLDPGSRFMLDARVPDDATPGSYRLRKRLRRDREA